MDTGSPIRLRTLLAGVLVASALQAHADTPESAKRYVGEPLVSVHGQPAATAPRVAQLPINTELSVETGSTAEWCLVHWEPQSQGYVECKLLRERPISIDEARSWRFPRSEYDPHWPEGSDQNSLPASRIAELTALLQRRFYFSPSLTDLYRYGRLLELAHPEIQARSGSGEQLPRDEPFEHMKAFLKAGVAGGRYTNPWRESSVTQLAYEVPQVREMLRMTRTRLPVARPSLFVTRDDLFVAVGEPFAERERSRISASGDILFSTQEDRAAELFDFAKSVATGQFSVELREREYAGDSSEGFWNFGQTLIHFAASPPVWVITREGATGASLKDLHVSEAAPCRSSHHTLRLALAEEPKRAPLLFLAVRQTLNPAKIRVGPVARSSAAVPVRWATAIAPSTWEIDANGDDIVDLVAVQTAQTGGVSVDFVTTVTVLANIAGAWQLVAQQSTVECA